MISPSCLFNLLGTVCKSFMHGSTLAFVLILLICGIPRVRMLSRQIAISTNLGLRIHAVWMRCKPLQFGRKNVYFLSYSLAVGIGVAQVLRPAQLCGWAPGLILKSICIIGCVRDPKLQAPLWDLFVFSPVAPSSFGSRPMKCFGGIRDTKFIKLAKCTSFLFSIGRRYRYIATG